MTAYGTQGQTVEFDTETTLGTALGSAIDLKVEEKTFPTKTTQVIENNPLGRENWANKSDKPITYEAVQEDAISITCNCRVNADNDDQLTKMATIGGFETDAADDTTCAITSGTINTVSNVAKPGRAHLVQLDTSGLYYPVLGAATETDGAVAITMNPPTDATAGNACLEMTTIYPQQAETALYGNFKWNTRGANTAANKLAYRASGCALASIGTISIEPNTPLKFQLGFHAAKIDQIVDEMNAESMGFLDKVPVTNCNFEFGFAASSDSWSIANTKASLIKADIDLNYSCVPISAIGNSCVNGVQGYFAKPGVPKITLDMIMDKAKWDDFEGTNPDKYLHFVQPTSAVSTTPVPAWGFWFPKCHLIDCPEMISEGDYYRMTLVYEAHSAGFESTTTNNSQGMSPWYHAVGGYKA